MEKKESPNKEGSVSAKASCFSSRALGIIKLVLGICFLPFVYSTTVAFLLEYSLLEKTISNYFLAGIITFLIIYLFMYEPVGIYQKGQRIVEVVFRFFTPLVKVASYLLPIYTIILFCTYFLYSLITKSGDSIRYFVCLFGFSIALHLIFSAKSLRTRQSDFLRANYIFGFSFIYIINLAILAFGFSIIFIPFSFVNFCNHSFQIAGDVFGAIFRQLFICSL